MKKRTIAVISDVLNSYVVTTAEGKDGTTTFSRNCWHGKYAPTKKQTVYLEDIVWYEKGNSQGWRAKAAFPESS
jgi:hypothetical protein